MDREKSTRRLRDDRDHHHKDDRHHRSSKDDRHHRSKDYSHDHEELKRERSSEPRIGREGSRDRDRERSYREESVEKRHQSHNYEDLKRERSSEPRIVREGSRERSYREESVEKRHRSHGDSHREISVERGAHKRKERGESEERLEKSEKRRKEEKREKRRLEDKDLDEGRGLNGGIKEDWEEQVEDGNGGISRNDKRDKRKFGDRVKEEDDEEDKYRGSDVKSEKRETGDERGSSHRKEKRKFGDRANDGEDKHRGLDVRAEKKETGGERGSSHRREKRKFGDRANDGDEEEDKDVKSENKEFIEDGGTLNRKSSNGVGAASLEPGNIALKVVSESPQDPPPTKVSSISTSNNKGVSVTRSHEVPEKSSTDGTTASVASKSGNLSLDALAKAKKALQMQKELSEKIKKIPSLHKVLPSNKERSQASSSSLGTRTVSTTSTTSASVITSASGIPSIAGLAAPNIEAVKRAQELAAKMGFRHDPEFAPVINMFPGQTPTDVTVQQKPSKAPVLRLDQYGNAIDEHGNVINMSKPADLSTLKVNINKQKKEAFQILKPDLNVDPESNPHFDERMGIDMGKLLRPKRMSFQFVEEGQWSKQAEITRLRSQFGEAQAKELKAKQAHLAKAKAEPDINPNLIELSERIITKEKPKDPIPDVEWWDVPLLRSGNYDVTEEKINEDNLNMDKITIYVVHPLPIEPPAEPAPPPPQPLKLTKKEQKKLRTQRRLAKEKDRQEMIRQGLIEPPKPKVKMSNLMKVLGSEATQDPTRLEMEIRNAAAEREQAHVDRNIARKLTPAERREKKERKLFEDPSTLETIVSVYKINDLSHPQTRFKVDVNAQENRLSGCVVMTDSMTVVVVEGGSKSIKRYGKLMLRRINWAAAVADDNDEDENEDKPANKCVLVWQGSVAKPNFHKFLVHQCRTEAAARKILFDAGVANYWDLAVNFNDEE